MSYWYVCVIDKKEKLYTGVTADLLNRMRQLLSFRTFLIHSLSNWQTFAFIWQKLDVLQ
jgi:hypothetical protein